MSQGHAGLRAFDPRIVAELLYALVEAALSECFLHGDGSREADYLRETIACVEKKVIIEEIKMYMDNPMSVAYEAAKAKHFGTHPLGQSILGSEASIAAMTASGMRASSVAAKREL